MSPAGPGAAHATPFHPDQLAQPFWALAQEPDGKVGRIADGGR